MVKTTVEKLFGSTDIYRIIVDSAEEGIWIADKDGVITFANKKMADLLGYDKEQLLGKKMYDFTDDKNRAIMKKSLEDSRKGKRDNYAYSIRNKRGEFVHMVVATTPMQDAKGEYIGTVELMSDVSMQKKYENELRNLAAIVESSDDAIIGKTLDGIITSWNAAAERLFGYSAGEVIGKNISIIIPPDHAGELSHILNKTKMGERIEHYETVRLSKDGKLIDVSISVSPVKDEFDRIIGASTISRDISERKRTEDVLQKLSMAVEQSPATVVITDTQGKIEYVNQKFITLTGFTREEAMGQKPSVLKSGKTPQDVYKGLWDSICSGREWRGEFINKKKNGELYYESALIAPIKDGLGNITHFIAVKEDITERKQAEEALTIAKQQAELYVDLMGHDINNMNHSAMGYLELALEKLETEKRLMQEDKLLIEKPLRTLADSSALINNVRKLQKLMTESVKTKPTDLNKIFREIEAMSTYSPHDRYVRIKIQHVPGIMVDANELLKDVFINLITNAVKHSNQEKSLTINVKVEPVNENGRKFYRCSVEDNGPGIPDELKLKLFHRFQRGATKAHGKGLGLYIVRTLVEGYHGKVWVEDRVKDDHTKGSRFVVMLPTVEK